MVIPRASQRRWEPVVIPEAVLVGVPIREVGNVLELCGVGAGAFDAHVLVFVEGGGGICRLPLGGHERLWTDTYR